MYDRLLEQNDRKILWIVDEIGNSGKSWFGKWLVCTHDNAIHVENAKTADIKFAYNFEDIVVFDYTRSVEERVNYEVIESLKNGIMFSGKYESISKCTTKTTRIICMSNFMPELSKFSKDRWDIWVLENNENICKFCNDKIKEAMGGIHKCNCLNK